ncbi:MAG: RNA pseudouridine synthase [Opitutales bacterium]|nr:RNA pseudouridine synthase [Opitutales bacterium]
MFQPPLHESVALLEQHSSGIIAVDKPSGIRSHPNRKHADEGALLQVPYDYDLECFSGEGQRWYLCNRLDAPTSGVLVLVADPGLAAVVKKCFQDRKVDKLYRALLRGRVRRPKETWRDRLRTRRTPQGLRTMVSSDGDPAVTEMVLDRYSESAPYASHVALRPKTGRTHQLRVQAAERRTPIVGDATYGDFRFNRSWARSTGNKRLYLHSEHVAFEVEWQGRRIQFSAEAPAPF